jgi:hypothetical protein
VEAPDLIAALNRTKSGRLRYSATACVTLRVRFLRTNPLQVPLGQAVVHHMAFQCESPGADLEIASFALRKTPRRSSPPVKTAEGGAAAAITASESEVFRPAAPRNCWPLFWAGFGVAVFAVSVVVAAIVTVISRRPRTSSGSTAGGR